jgi:aspartate carbamoyltransferase catalytic subunit
VNLKHLISAQQLDKQLLNKIFTIADRIKAGNYKNDLAKDKIMATLFYEPSTRTRLSFESAMLRLGGQVLSTENASEFSSVAKGETLEDTIRVVHSYCDLIVLRHPTPGASQIAADFSNVPIINAGDGEGEHPTQALLDAYTIFRKTQKEKLTITMVGDLKFGRTIHSLAYLLANYREIKIVFVSPKTLSAPQRLKDHLSKSSASFEETENLEKAIPQSDVIYMTRIQKERFKNLKDYRALLGKYILDKTNMKLLKKNAIVMHPLPRVNEINPEIDSDPRAIYFEQTKNGVFCRMALLAIIFDNQNKKTS